MDVYVTFRHMESTDSLRTYVKQKAARMEKYLLKGPHRMNIIFSLERFVHRVDLMLFEKNGVFKAQGLTNDMYASVDQAMHSLEEQLKRYKDRTKHHKNYFKSGEGRLADSADIFDQRLMRVRQSKRTWKKRNRVLRKKVA